jgi:1,4-alpha-glucan branching enzyme
MDLQQFFDGKAFDAYEYFGAHATDNGYIFRVYAVCEKCFGYRGI